MRLQKTILEGERISSTLESRLHTQLSTHEAILEQKQNMYQSLESSYMTSKIENGELSNQIFTLKSDSERLESALASLHGEIAVNAREIGDLKDREKHGESEKYES